MRDTGQAAFFGSSVLDVMVADQASMIARRRLGGAGSWFEGCFDLLLGWLAGCLLVENPFAVLDGLDVRWDVEVVPGACSGE